MGPPRVKTEEELEEESLRKEKAEGKGKGKGKKSKPKAEEDDENEPPKEKKGKKGKDPNAPKRPMSAYFLFMNEVRDATKAETPGLKIGDIAKLLGERWGKMEDEEKSKYQELAKEAKE